MWPQMNAVTSITILVWKNTSLVIWHGNVDNVIVLLTCARGLGAKWITRECILAGYSHKLTLSLHDNKTARQTRVSHYSEPSRVVPCCLLTRELMWQHGYCCSTKCVKKKKNQTKQRGVLPVRQSLFCTYHCNTFWRHTRHTPLLIVCIYFCLFFPAEKSQQDKLPKPDVLENYNLA